MARLAGLKTGRAGDDSPAGRQPPLRHHGQRAGCAGPQPTRKKDTMKPSRLTRTAVPLLALGLAACGTGGTTPHATAAATSAAGPATAMAAAGFATAADRVCAVQNQRERALGPGLVNPDIVTAVHLPKAAAYLDKIIAIRDYGLPALQRLVITGDPAGRAARLAFLRAYQNVVADYRAAARAAKHGDLAAFRAAFGKVAPHGYPTGPDAKAFAHAAAAFPFKQCGKAPGL